MLEVVKLFRFCKYNYRITNVQKNGQKYFHTHQRNVK